MVVDHLGSLVMNDVLAVRRWPHELTDLKWRKCKGRWKA